MRAVTLARVSTPGQAEHGYSLDDQDRIFLRHIQAKAYTLIEMVRDEGFSGQLSQRPGLSRVMELVRARVVDVVLFVKMDRVGREQRIILNTIHEIKKHGVRVEFVEHVSGDTKEERLQLGVLASVAEFQWETIKQITTDGRYNKARSGAFPSHLDVYGYHQITAAEAATNPAYAGRSGHLVVVEEEAEIIREVFRRFVGGESMRSLTFDLVARRIPAPRGPQWSINTIQRMLARPTYVGRLYYGQMACQKVDELTRGGKQRTKREHRPASEWVEIPCPAIVDEATFQAAQRILQNNRARYQGRPSAAWPLRGTVFSAVCAGHYGEPRRYVVWRHSSVKSRSTYSIRYYICSCKRKVTLKQEGWCGGLLNAVKLEEQARAMLDEVIQPGRLGQLAYEQVERENRSRQDLPAEKARHTKRLKKLEEEERNLIRLARQGVQSAILGEELKQIQAQRTELQNLILNVEEQLRACQQPEEAQRRAEEASQHIRERLAHATADEEPTLLQSIYQALFVIMITPGEEPVFEIQAAKVVLPW